MAKLNKRGKIVFAIISIALFVFGVRVAMRKGLIPTPGVLKSVTASKVALPDQKDAEVANVTPAPFPEAAPAQVATTRLPVDIWSWPAYSGMLYAAGGPTTAKGSFFERFGVNVAFKKTNSNSVMKQDLLDCAQQLKSGEKTCSNGAGAIVVMGDGLYASWIADLNPQLEKLGPEYKLKVIGAVGRGNGGDALMGPQEWKDNPQTMKGKTIVGVILDGDWNIALNYMGSNGLTNNPDLATYDPEAVNWIQAPDEDYIKAVTEVFVPNRCEDRKVKKNGVLTGETVKVCPDGVVTWYPGDKMAIEGKSGTVKIVSSREYAAQMPSVIVGIDKFFKDNRDAWVSFLAGTFLGSDQIKAFDAARKKAGEISYAVYGKEESPDFWYKAYSGYKVAGQPVGGDVAFGLQDNLQYFGLAPGFNNNMRATYETFARIAREQYPERFKGEVPGYKEIVDTSYILGAQAKLNEEGVEPTEGEKPDYTAAAASGQVLGKKAVYISFDSGSDEPTAEGKRQLAQLRDELAVNSSLALQIDGFTDNTGSDQINVPLSESRAFAVKKYFQQTAGQSFPNTRFVAVKGHGSQNPIAPNTSGENKAKNRRVEITQIGG